MLVIVPFALTDDQWVEATRHLPFPDAARTDLDYLGSNYLTFQNAAEQRSPNSKVETDLLQVARAADKLFKLLRELGPDAILALTDPDRSKGDIGPKPRFDAMLRLTGQIEALERLRTWFDGVARDLPEQRRGFDPGNLNWLVSGAASIYERHASQPFAGQPGRRKFIAAYVGVVDPGIGDGSINNAVAALGSAHK